MVHQKQKDTSNWQIIDFEKYDILLLGGKMENQVNIDNQNSQQIGQNPIVHPSVVTKRPKVNFWMISTFILSVILIATVIYAVNLKSRQIDNLQIPNLISTSYTKEIPEKTPTQEPTKTPTIEESSTQIFRNENFGYEISYPKTWQKTDNIPVPCPDPAEVIGTGSVVDLSEGGFSQTQKDFIRPRLQIEAFPGTEETNVESLAKSPSGCFIYRTTDAKRNLKEELIYTKDGQKMFVTTAIILNDKVYGRDIFYGCGYVIANKYLYVLTWHDSKGDENPELKKIFTSMSFFKPGRDSCKQW